MGSQDVLPLNLIALVQGAARPRANLEPRTLNPEPRTQFKSILIS